MMVRIRRAVGLVCSVMREAYVLSVVGCGILVQIGEFGRISRKEEWRLEKWMRTRELKRYKPLVRSVTNQRDQMLKNIDNRFPLGLSLYMQNYP